MFACINISVEGNHGFLFFFITLTFVLCKSVGSSKTIVDIGGLSGKWCYLFLHCFISAMLQCDYVLFINVNV